MTLLKKGGDEVGGGGGEGGVERSLQGINQEFYFVSEE